MRRLAATLTVLTTIAGCSATESKPEWLSQANLDARQAPIAARASSGGIDDDLPPPPDSAKWLLPGAPARPSTPPASSDAQKEKPNLQAAPGGDLMADPKPPGFDASAALTGRYAPPAEKIAPEAQPIVHVKIADSKRVPSIR